MICDDVEKLEESYLLGELEREEMDQVGLHLRVCTRCRERINQYEELLGRMFNVITPVVPAPEVRQQVISRVAVAAPKPAREKRRWFPPIRFGLVYNVAVTALMLLFAGLGAMLYGQVQDLNNRQAENQKIVALTSLPDSLVWVMTPPDTSLTPTTPRARMYARADSDLYLVVAANIPQAPAGKVYQFWYSVGNNVEYGGFLPVDKQGNASMKITDPNRAALDISSCFVTLETPSIMPSAPTGQPVLIWKKPVP